MKLFQKISIVRQVEFLKQMKQNHNLWSLNLKDGMQRQIMHIILWFAQILDYCLYFFFKDDMPCLYIAHLLMLFLQPDTRIRTTPKVTSGYIWSRVRKIHHSQFRLWEKLNLNDDIFEKKMRPHSYQNVSID